MGSGCFPCGGIVNLFEDEIADGVIVEIACVPIDSSPALQGNEVAMLDEEPLYSCEVVGIVRYALSGQDVAKARLLLFLGSPDDEGNIELVRSYDAVMLAVAETIAAQLITSDLQFLPCGEGGEYCLRLLRRAVDRKKVQLVVVPVAVYAGVAFADDPFVFDRDNDGII
jgi:hypothetical protein